MRMKYIKRWGLMRNTEEENIKEHSADVAYIAHALAVIANKRFGGNVNVERVVMHALYHDVSEVITGDLATPIKYFNPEIKDAYKKLEANAVNKIRNMLPDDLAEEYSCLNDPEDERERKIVKAADKLSAYFKCLEEISSGNNEFAIAKQTLCDYAKGMGLPEVDFFIDTFADSITLTLDELK